MPTQVWLVERASDDDWGGYVWETESVHATEESARKREAKSRDRYGYSGLRVTGPWEVEE